MLWVLAMERSGPDRTQRAGTRGSGVFQLSWHQVSAGKVSCMVNTQSWAKTDTSCRTMGPSTLKWVSWAVFSFATADTRSEEHTSELQSLMRITYAVFCLKKKN